MALSLLPFTLGKSNYTWDKALLWGNSLGHFKKCQRGSLGERSIHLIIAVAEAIPLIGQIVSIFETLFFKEIIYKNGSVASSLHDLSANYLADGSLHQFAELFEECLAIDEQFQEKMDPVSCAKFGGGYLKLYDETKSTIYSERAINLFKQFPKAPLPKPTDDSYPEITKSLRLLSSLYESQGDYEKAGEVYDLFPS